MQLKNVQLFHPSHPHPVLGFTPSSIKTPVIIESRTKGPPRVTVPSLSLYCTHRCLAWEQHGHISIRVFFYWPGIKSPQFLSQVRKKTMRRVVSGADRKERGWGCAFLTSFAAEKLLYLDLFFLRNSLFPWWRSTYVVNTCRWPVGDREDIPGGTHVPCRDPSCGMLVRNKTEDTSQSEAIILGLWPFN